MSGRTYRSNPGYHLVLRENLSADERGLIDGLGEQSAAYGVFRPRESSGLEWRSASTETALLFFTLAAPGPIPGYVRERLQAQADAIVSRLVLDGVLQVEHDGVFCSGPDALDLLLPPSSMHEDGAIGRLSLAALQYAQMLGGLTADALCMRLYFYGRKPVSPAWQNRLPDEAAVKAFLGMGHRGPMQSAIDASWTEDRIREPRFWRQWSPAGTGVDSDSMGYKLYVSPVCESLRETLRTTFETLSGAPGVVAIKVGRDVEGLLRPDKLVIYFATLEQLQAAAVRLQLRLRGTPPHGVPFTAEITRDGLLSWGVDPPSWQRLVDGRGEGSWRLWIVNRLAEYLLAARGGADAATARRFALDRLRLDGVDTRTWIPKSTLKAQWTAGSE